MKIEERREGKTVVLSIEGRLDHAGCQVFDAHVSKLVAAGERSLVVDFHGVDFLASMGIRALIKPYQALAPQGGKVVAANVCDSVRTVFQIAGIDKAIPIYDSVEAAMAAA
jgi:stage II sporulation protein AA (anti-sigma F factor antagonist)